VALQKPNSIPAKIKSLDLYLNGNAFTAKQVCSRLGIAPNAATAALGAMVDRRDLLRMNDGRYYRPRRHWIHQLWNADLQPHQDEQEANA
jgi:hypothetical protein